MPRPTTPVAPLLLSQLEHAATLTFGWGDSGSELSLRPDVTLFMRRLILECAPCLERLSPGDFRLKLHRDGTPVLLVSRGRRRIAFNVVDAHTMRWVDGGATHEIAGVTVGVEEAVAQAQDILYRAWLEFTQ